MNITPNNKKIQSAIESLYCGTMDVIERRGVKDENTKITAFEEVIIMENIPCRISFSGFPENEQSVGAAEKSQSIRLFCAPDIDIPEGSKIAISQHGVTQNYMRSGTAAVYKHHREYNLVLFERWA